MLPICTVSEICSLIIGFMNLPNRVVEQEIELQEIESWNKRLELQVMGWRICLSITSYMWMLFVNLKVMYLS